jgi:hypothetical protein
MHDACMRRDAADAAGAGAGRDKDKEIQLARGQSPHCCFCAVRHNCPAQEDGRVWRLAHAHLYCSVRVLANSARAVGTHARLFVLLNVI